MELVAPGVLKALFREDPFWYVPPAWQWGFALVVKQKGSNDEMDVLGV